MKQNLKRLLSVLLAVVMLLGMVPAAVAAEEGGAVANLAAGQAVTATTSESGGGLYSPAFLTDGKFGDYPTDQHLGWCVTKEGSATVKLEAESELTEIKLYPCVFESGKWFPSAFTVSVSTDGETWTQVGQKTDIPAGGEVHSIPLEHIKAAYVKVDVVPRTMDATYGQISELEVYGVAGETEQEPGWPPIREDLENVALNQPVSATSVQGETTYYDPSYLVDGSWLTVEGGNTKLGWCSSVYKEEETIDVTVHLDKLCDLEQIVVKPMKWSKGESFPRAYELQVSTDGTAWTTVASESDMSALVAQDVDVVPRVYNIETAQAKFFRIHITEQSAMQDAGSGNHYSAIGELELRGSEHLDNVAIGQSITASSSHSEATYYHVNYLNDGSWLTVENGNTKLGWSSSPDDDSLPCTIDMTLDQVYELKKIVLKPMKWSEGNGFPKAYALQLSMDGETWTTVASDSDVSAGAASNTAVQPKVYQIEPTQARFFRMEITEHSALEDGGTRKPYSQIGEIELLGTETDAGTYGTENVALGGKVTSTNYYIGSMATIDYMDEFLTDGGEGPANYKGWATKLDIESETTPAEIVLELEGVFAVEHVVMVPIVSEADFFPMDYTISLSQDGKSWTEIANVKDAPTELADHDHAVEEPMDARYVKIEITRHRNVNGTVASRFAELEVYGDVVKRDPPHINKPALRMNVDSEDYLYVSYNWGDPVTVQQWTSSDEAVVTVDDKGNVKATGLGTATITADYGDGKAECEVLVDTYDATEELMITAFWPMQDYNINEAYMDAIANAGITNIQNQFSMNIANYNDNIAIAKMAYERGIGLTVGEKEWGWGRIANYTVEEIQAEARKYSHIPGVIGYFVTDEPPQASIYAHTFGAFKSVMPNADVHLNFVPNRQNYVGLLESVENVSENLEYLMWDRYIYPNGDGIFEESFFAVSEEARALALKYGVKTSQYIQSMGFNGTMRSPSGDDIRYNVNAALAYGNKQIAYFCFREPEILGGGETYYDAIVETDGTPTEKYASVAETNFAAQAMGPTLMSVEALGVYHTGEQNGATKEVPEDFFLKASSSSSRGLIVSFMRNMETKQNYVMLVNRDYKQNATAAFTVSEDITSLHYVSQETGELVEMPKTGDGYSVDLLPGGCILLKVQDDFDYTPNYGVYVEVPANENIAQNEYTALSGAGKDLIQLNDGGRITNTYRDGCAMPGYTASVGGGHTVAMTFGGPQTVNRVDLYPGDSAKFPMDFVLEGTEDGETWTPLVTETGYQLPENKVYTTEVAEAKYTALRLTVTKTESGELQIAEWEVYHDDGSMGAPRDLTAFPVDRGLEPADNLARADGVKVMYSHSYESPDYWKSVYINDGVGYDAIPQINAGWSSHSIGFDKANNSVWIGYDLGAVKSINKVVAFSCWEEHADNQGNIKESEGFPADYIVEVSMDGETWTPVHAVYNDTNWTKIGARVMTFEPVNGRYVRLNCLRLAGSGYGFMAQVSELEVYGEDADIGDKTALNALIDAAKALKEEDYTPETWSALEEALTAAEAVAQKEDATQEEVDAAANVLKAAMEALVEAPVAVDKTALDAAIAAAKALNRADYTAATWAELEKALAVAEAVARKEDATQEEVDTAAALLRAAINGLKRRFVIRPVIGSIVTAKPAFPFTDVAETAWYYEEVKEAWESGLIDGMTADKFAPEGSLTVAQAIKLAAALHQMYNTGKVTLENGSPNWYSTYVDYAVANEIIEEKYAGYTKAQMNAAIHRDEFVHIFFGAMPESAYEAINTVAADAIPDVKSGDSYADEIYTFYRAGILTGNDAAGTFYPDSCINRAEMSAILIRMYDFSARHTLNLL